MRQMRGLMLKPTALQNLPVNLPPDPSRKNRKDHVEHRLHEPFQVARLDDSIHNPGHDLGIWSPPPEQHKNPTVRDVHECDLSKTKPNADAARDFAVHDTSRIARMQDGGTPGLRVALAGADHQIIARIFGSFL